MELTKAVVSGEAFHCNDWITADDAPHPKEITSLWVQKNERLALKVKLANGSLADLDCAAEGTVKNHVSNILSKLGVRDRTRAVLKALESGLL